MSIRPGGPSKADLSGTYAQLATDNTYTGTETFNNPTFAKIGTDLVLKLVTGNGAQRLHLTGQGTTQNPFFEIVPATTTPDTYATDPTVAGHQVYRVGKGSAVDREFFAIEAAGVAQQFRVSSWASGTGAIRPIVFQVGSAALGATISYTIQADGKIMLGAATQLYYNGGTQPVPIMLRANGDVSQEIRVHSAVAGDVPRYFAGRTRGTAAAVTPPQSGDILADFRGGSINNELQIPSGVLRFKAAENWTFGTLQGTSFEIRTTAPGTAGLVSAAIFQEPADGQVALLIRRNVGGTLTQQQVTMGAVDSGGAGFKVLRVPN